MSGMETRFQAFCGGDRWGEIRLAVPGKHNVYNALACIAAARMLELDFDPVAEALASFRSVSRRLERKGCEKNIVVLDDYAHHPTAIKFAIEVGRLICQGRLYIVFQPHRYSRTQQLLKEFGGAFCEADEVIVCDIYAAGEAPIEGVSAQKIVEKVRNEGRVNAMYVPERVDIVRRLVDRTRPGDLVMTLGAGDVDVLADQYLEELRAL